LVRIESSIEIYRVEKHLPLTNLEDEDLVGSTFVKYNITNQVVNKTSILPLFLTPNDIEKELYCRFSKTLPVDLIL
jgi:hypothetical protein